MAISALGAGMFVPFTNVFWKISYSLDDDTIGQIFAVSALIMTGVTVVAPMLTRRWGLVRVLSITRVFAVVGLLGFGFSPWFMLALVGFLGRDILMNLSRPLTDQFQMEQTAVEERAIVSSLSVMVFNLAWAAASGVSGIWQTQGNFTWVFVASGGFYLLSVWLLYVFFGKSPAPISEDVAAHSTIVYGTTAE
jgi:MFS family permease